MKDFKILLLLLFVSLFGIASCDDNTEENEYNNWLNRNIAFIDSVAGVARLNSDGNWKVFPATGLDENKEHGNEYNVYCHVLEKGSGTTRPASTDIVKVNYKGMPINGNIFDGSYVGELEPEFDVPATFVPASTVIGFSTAIQQMVVGDIWRVYIPANLGYGVQASSAVPANSALIFEINLVAFNH